MMYWSHLWTAEDELDQQILRDAERKDDLLGALLAIEGCPQELRDTAQQTITSWGERITQELAQEPSEQLQALVRVLVDDLSLEGDREEYQHPRNSHLSEVLERRKGLPIILSTIWMMVGRASGIEMDGVGMPGHFLLRVGGVEGVYVDPFDRGRVLSLADCQAIVAKLSEGRLPWNDAYLAPSTIEEILERILRNLINAYAQREDLVPLYRSLALLATIRPDRLELWLQQGRIAEFVGDIPRAILALDTYLACAVSQDDLHEEFASIQRKVAALRQTQALPN